MLALLDSLAVSFDLPILEWIQANLRTDFLDFFMPIITLFGSGGIFWIGWAVLLLLFTKKYRGTGAAMGLALLFGVIVCNLILKPAISRMRPYDFQELHFGKEILLLVGPQSDKSFPSGHTIASFEAGVVLLLRNKRMGIPAMVLAVLVTFSRLYLYVHYPTDVIASIILGTAFAFAGNAIVNALEPKVVARLEARKEQNRT